MRLRQQVPPVALVLLAAVVLRKVMMHPDLGPFLAEHLPMASDRVSWGERMRLRATAYLSGDTPPLAYATSVRAVVLCNRSVLVQEDRDSRHVLPGGRREPGESIETTLRREVAEETGWSLGRATLLGFTHFHHLDPKPRGYVYPYPDFCWLIFAAEVDTFSAATKLDDGYEVGLDLLPVETVRALSLTRYERIYLDAALRIDQSPRLRYPIS